MMIKMKYLIILMCLMLAACESSNVQDKLVVQNAFMNQLPPGQSTAAVYLSLENHTSKTQVLNHVYSTYAEKIEVHRTIYDQGLMQMRPVNHVSVDPDERLLFSPSGYHLMLFGVTPIPANQTFTVTLEFESGINIVAQVDVRPVG